MTEESRCLMVVDDEEDFRKLFGRHFRKRGYEVIEAADGVEAIERFTERSHDIDLVVTDIRMPNMDGRELIRELRKRRRFLPIIGITGQADLQETLAFLDDGAYYYLDKPLPHWSIVDRLVDNAVQLHHREEEVQLSREKEREIARLLRSYILKGPIPQDRDEAPSPDRRFALDIAIEPIEIAQPSGDYVEWFERDGDEVIFYVADASGHNDLVSSFTACLSNMVLHRCHHGTRPSVDRIIMLIDQALDELRSAGALGTNKFLTFFIGCINLVTGGMSYVNAGHPDAFLVRPHASGSEPASVHRLKTTCRPVGHISLFNQNIEVGSQRLRTRDLLFIYTDGASETLESVGGWVSGINRLETVVREVGNEPAREVVDRIAAYLRQQVGPEGFEDDTTLMAIRILAA